MDIQFYNGLKFYLNHGKIPTNLDDDTKRSIGTRAHDYFTKDGQLFFHKNKNEEPLIVVNSARIEQVLREGHSGTLTGHFNTEATYKKLRRSFYWPKMYKIVEEYVTTCATCQRRGKPKKKNLLHPITVSEPFELIGMDLIGPLPETSNGNKYIIVMTEYLTKWVEAEAIPDKKASTVAKFLYKNVITRFGTPKKMLSDQGTEFLNETIKALQDVMGIKGTHSTPYHPQANGMTERMN